MAIVQVGLLQTWLWEPVITHILRPNPSVIFVYFADFHNATAPRRYRKTDQSRAIVDLAHALNAMSAQPNFQRRNVTVRTELPRLNKAAPKWPTQYNRATRVVAATIVQRMRDMVLQTISYAYTMCIREDALWYHPLRLNLLTRDEHVIFKPCMNYGGVNNKAIAGRPANVHELLTRLHASFWHAPANVPPYNLESLLKQTLQADKISYAQPRATFDSEGTMLTFGLTLSDGVRRPDRMCYRGRYWGGKRANVSHIGGCGENMRARVAFAIC